MPSLPPAAGVLLAVAGALGTAALLHHQGEWALALVAAATPALLLVRRRWALRLFQGLTVAGAVAWLTGTARAPLLAGGALALLGVAGLWEVWRRRYPGRAGVSVAAAALTLALLVPVHLVVDLRMILVERLVPGAGWLQILGLAVYAAWLAERMTQDPARWRGRLWILFSVAFFAQLLLGLSGLEDFLLTGKLHLPVPAVILGGPLYRGEGLFMPILFGATLLLVGPAWCSHLCYVGAWDHVAASLGPKRPQPLPAWRPWARVGTTVAVVGVALGLSWVGASAAVATGLGLAFGLAGVGLMATWSRRTGAMTHCTAWCPMGLLATKLGRISPFRVQFRESACTECMVCTRSCRYDALQPAHVRASHVGEACTLCGDCVSTCPHGALEYQWLWLRGEQARGLFLALVVGLHAAFLGLAMI